MRLLAVLFASIPVLGSALVGLLLWLIATFPWENQDQGSDPGNAFALLVGATLASLLFAALLLCTVALNRPREAIVAFALHAAAAVVMLGVALGESDHSDDKLLGFAAAVELSGLVAVVVCRSAHELSLRPPSSR